MYDMRGLEFSRVTEGSNHRAERQAKLTPLRDLAE